MKTKLMLALTLSVLAANTFAADGYDRTVPPSSLRKATPLTTAAPTRPKSLPTASIAPTLPVPTDPCTHHTARLWPGLVISGESKTR